MKINRAYVGMMKYPERFIIYYGGAGSGKSYGIGQNILIDMMTKTVGWMVVRAVARTIRESVFALLKTIIYQEEWHDHFKINNTEMSITHVTTKARLISFGLDDVEKIKSVADITHVWIEETTEIKEADFTQLNLRIRGVGTDHKIIMSFNPVSSLSWIKRMFFDIAHDNARIIHTTFKHNAFLDEEYKKELYRLKDYDYYRYKVYTEGLWADISNARVFHNIIVEDFTYKQEDLENVRWGQDYGFNHATTLVGTGYRDGELYIFEENYYKERTNRQCIELVEKTGFDKRQLITADSAEPDRIKEWNEYGFRVVASKKGKGSLKNGIDYLRGLPKIHIHKTNCPNAAREFLGYKHRELKDGTIDDTFVELDDDVVAGVRYGNEEFWRYRPRNMMTRRF